ncbi:MAG: carotenoid 1,2-hydratase [Ramlibacter sp.]|uniref:lipocalin-like domain-containing protein n=1 Tax=Ramlibacter sp. TaxID=1917967 RepID=UPI00261848B7|nr:carotenoid 1,2-hydratase [Ramlibacter sp.]MDH4375527.1 carotenoid 1,2-hydratase [Ramlibacter sp.]
MRTEWWYLTGQAAAGDRRWGFQVTFFRSRVDATRGMTSAFAARELLFAHAAVTDLATGRLHHDQRIARAGFGVAQAGLADTDLRIRDWTLIRQPDGRYLARVEGGDFALELDATPTQPLLLQGQDGLSRKGPEPTQASYYYSQPQLQVQGRLRLGKQASGVTGRAWLDHEWSEALLHPQAVGWDWVGMNLADGSALTVFQLRRADGSALWAGGSWRAAGGAVQAFGPQAVRMVPTRYWSSPLTGTRYPVAWTLDTPQGRFQVEALADAQELDSRRSTGTVYWEGLSELRDAAGQPLGQGYLELTGYGDRLRI